MFGLDTNQILMIALAGLAVLFGVPGAKDKLLELIGNLFKPKAKIEELAATLEVTACQSCSAAWEILRAHAIEHGNTKAQQKLNELWPDLFPVEGQKVPVPFVPDGVDEILAAVQRELAALRAKVERLPEAKA